MRRGPIFGHDFAAFDFITSDSDYNFFTRKTVSFNSLSIGDPSPNRWIVVVASVADGFANSYITSVTLNGNAMTLATRTINEPEAVAIYYRKVTTGTTANFVVNENSGTRSYGIGIYRLISKDVSPLYSVAQAEATTAASIGSVPQGRAVVSVQASTNYATAPTIGGQAINDFAINIDGNDYIRGYHSNNTTSSTQSITSIAEGSNHAIAVFNYR